MTHASILRDKAEVLGFDVYDTLLPFRPKLVPFFRAYLDARGYDTDPEELFETWQSELFYHMNVNNAVNDPRPPILEVGHRALRSVLTEAGFEYTGEEVREMLDPWTELEPHDDVVENFERLGEEYTLVGLSNGDPDMLEAVRPSLQGTVDAMLSSARAGVFKPAPEPYELLVDRFDVAAHEVMYVAVHDFDIIGPQRVGMYACFVERVDPYGEWPTEPDLRVETLDGLSDALL
jgi:2-haloacid dehalogenase